MDKKEKADMNSKLLCKVNTGGEDLKRRGLTVDVKGGVKKYEVVLQLKD